MPFMDLFSQPGSPLAILNAAGGMPQPGTREYYNAMATGRGLPDSMPQGQGPVGGGANLVTSPGLGPNVPGPNPLIDLLSNQNNYAGYGRGYTFTPDQAPSVPGAATNTSAGVAAPSSQSISDLINSLLGKAPTIDQVFNSKPYEDAITKLASNKTDAAKGIGDSYTKALAQLAAVTASAKQDQGQFASQTQTNGQQAQAAQQAFLQSIGANGGEGSALGAMLQGQAARMATDQSNQANTNSRLASVQNNDLSQASQDAALGQMGALNQLNTQTAGAQSKIGTQEATDRASAMKELAAMMTARQSQAGSLLNNAQTFIGKNTTSTNSRTDVQNQLAQMQQSGDGGTPSAFNSIVYGGDPDGKGGYTVGAKNQAEAIQRLQAARGTLQQHGIDASALQNLIGAYYQNTTTQQAPPDIMSSLQEYLKALVGAGS